MDTLGYISEIAKPGPLREEYTMEDLHFLCYIAEGDSTKYKIHVRENKSQRGLSYKNIHRRVEKLFNNGLIEEVKIEGGYKHGARNFKLTDRGLIYLISELGKTDSILSFAEKYPHNILLKTFLYKYFERNTIRNATYSLIKLVTNYLIECSMITIFFLRDAELYQFDEAKSIEDIINNPAFEQMNYFLEWMVNSFIVKVSMMNKKHIDWRQHQFPLSKDHFPTQGIIACSANDQEQTYSLLAKDKKFMQKLRDIEEEFRNGFERLVNLG